jgi:hypothetical protein
MTDQPPIPAAPGATPGRAARIASAATAIAHAFGPYVIALACLGVVVSPLNLSPLATDFVKLLFGGALIAINPTRAIAP